ncbi:MAG: LPS assembly protein LptD [Pseudomonadota bacterium]|nr:LPS assembly protein LptD [Pseudomonadota bacterium]
MLGALGSGPLLAANDDIGFARGDVCPQPRIDVPTTLRKAEGGDPDLMQTIIEGDEIELLPDNTVILLGNAQIIQGRRGVYADKITYSRDAYQATAEGNVKYYGTEGDKVTTDHLELEVDTFVGDSGPAQFWMVDRQPLDPFREHEQFVEDYSAFAPFRLGLRPGLARPEPDLEVVRARGRATADKVYFEGHDFERLEGARLTTCPEGNEDVVLTAKEVELDHASGIGTGKNMTVRFKNLPIFYFPRASFPIDDQRKSGFLFPSIGYDQDGGAMVSAPFYWNIAPNYDATFIPRYMSERGGQLYSEFRYMGHSYNGALRGEYMPDDRLYGDGERYAFGYDHDQNISERWHGLIDLQTVSDNDYLKDFSNNVQVYSATHLPQIADLTYYGDYVYFEAEAAAFETIDDRVEEENYPYRTLPRTVFDVNPVPLGMFETGLNSSVINFDHEESDKTKGWRLNAQPWLSMPLDAVYGYVTPKVSVGFIQDSLDSGDPLQEENPSVAVPRFSLDSTVFFERDTFLLGENMIQTLEPRLFYVYAPAEEQDDLPIFDTGVGDVSSFSYFFRENRFFGGDRYGDSNRLTLGLTSRFLTAADGAQRMNLSLGEVFFFDDREIVLQPEDDDDETSLVDDALTRGRSDFLAELTGEIGKDWDLYSFFRYDHDESLTRTFRLGTTYNHSDRRSAGLVYWYDHELQEQLELRLNWALSPRWQIQLDELYSLHDDESRATGINITYDSCCWALRVGAYRSLRNDGEFKDAIALTFELDSLGAIRTGF